MEDSTRGVDGETLLEGEFFCKTTDFFKEWLLSIVMVIGSVSRSTQMSEFETRRTKLTSPLDMKGKRVISEKDLRRPSILVLHHGRMQKAMNSVLLGTLQT